MRIAVISIYSFPVGFATTNRILAYSKGMVGNGAEVAIFNPFPTDAFNSTQYGNEGVFEGVSYNFTSGRHLCRYRLFRGIARLSGLRRITGYFTSCYKIYKEHKKKRFNCLIISTDEIRSLWVYSNFARILNIPSVFIFDEFPTPIRHKLKNRIPDWKEYLYKRVLKKINGYISISDELKTFYCHLADKPSYILSVIVDISRFDASKINTQMPDEGKYLCYMGNMELSKDDVDNIIRSFALISHKYGDLKFYLYGVPTPNTVKYLEDLIISLKLEQKVFLKGKAISTAVPQILYNSYILVSSQPDTKRASGGFPTKLGEYLATGIPALLTDVGENAKYVKDNEHAFFSKPGDPEAYAEKLSYIIDNYDHALRIAENGQHLLFDNFSHIAKGKEMLNYISTLQKSGC